MSTMVAILPCNDLDTSEAFYRRLGFSIKAKYESYRILAHQNGAELHLTSTVEGWVVPERNPFGVYLYTDNVDELAASLRDHIIGPVEDKPWGMYEFAVSDPNGTLVRVGRPSTNRP
jgi:catechol 2,3-dioxygenase-like lactoylglutathione lyase family enzyme